MRKLIIWALSSAVLMIGAPWLAATFASNAGMAICFLLFFIVNPLFSAVCGFSAGKNIKRFWMLPIIVAVLFLAGVWLFFDVSEVSFLLYGVAYLVIGTASMLLSNFLRNRASK